MKKHFIISLLLLTIASISELNIETLGPDYQIIIDSITGPGVDLNMQVSYNG